MILKDCIEDLHKNFPDVTKTQLRAITDAIFAKVGSLPVGEKLIIREFGTFKAVMTKERNNGRSPKTGESGLHIPSKRLLKFRMSK